MYELKYKVTTSTCGEDGRLKMFSALQMMQDCSELWFTSEPVFKQFCEETGMTQVLAFRQVEMVRMPEFCEDLTVRTTVYEATPRFGFRNTVIYDAKGEPCLLSWSMGAFVKRDTGALSPVPDDVCKSVEIVDKIPMNYLSRKIAMPKTEGRVGETFTVRHDYIDYNSHVNNAQYIRLAIECLPAGFAYSGLRVEFKTPARMGDELTSTIYEEDERIVVVQKVGDKVCTIIEFHK